MRILLDTQVWLWMLAEPDRLGSEARLRIEDPRTVLLLSAASAWEIAIKAGLGKLELPGPPASVVPEMMAATGVEPLPVLHSHALRVASLPDHHRDPFDRLLIAQAQLERVPILTADPAMSAYAVDLLPA